MVVEKTRILVAEDDPVFRRVIVFTLERAGFTVFAAGNGKEAWDYLQSHEIDCLVSDHQMPIMSGIELVQRIEESSFRGLFPIVMCTAKSLEFDSDFLTEHYRLAAIMQKPFSPAGLVGVLKEVCTATAEKELAGKR